MIPVSFTESYELNNGVKIPCIGFGTYKTPPEDTRRAVLEAIDAGYRLIDTAAYYRNEAGVGEAVRECGVPREELFITSKVWNTDRGYDKTLAAFDRTMEQLGLDYLDLYLIHWPAGLKAFGERAKDINRDTWRAMEKLYRDGRVRAIGCSNFLPHHIEEIMETEEIKPMVNQIEFHPGWAQLFNSEYCLKNGIAVEAWSPFARGAVLDNETLAGIGRKYGKTSSQVTLRWIMQHGIIPLPKSVHRERMDANLDCFDFMLNEEEMSQIDALENLGGKCAMPDQMDD
ncbi:MAG: aldo/keto reductase [Anaerovoracaceae bacterium]|nr:aldo/keto reductase [Anaerovoracaceae bacterium]